MDCSRWSGGHPFSYSLPERVDYLVPEDVLNLPIRWEGGFEEHGIQHRGAGEEAVVREDALGNFARLAATLQSRGLKQNKKLTWRQREIEATA